MTLLRIGLLALLLASQTTQAVVAQNTDKNSAASPRVEVQLVASAQAVTPGGELYIGLHQKIIPHWHTYWINPGDSGLATTIKWDLPAGASASEILWPIPSRSNLGPITNYSYSDQVTLLNKIQVPKDLVVGNQFTAVANVDWLVCNEECIPEEAKLELTLPVVATTAETGKGHIYIDTALAQLPVDSPWPIRIEPTKNGFRLHVALPSEQATQLKDIWFYPKEWGRLVQNQDQPHRVVGNGVELDLPGGEAPLAAGQALSGVLVVTLDTPAGPQSTGLVVEQVPGVAPSSQAEGIGFAAALLLALAGGIILNLMPCVFPVLSLKALSLVSHADQSPAQTRLHGWVYTLGVVASFIALALILVILKAGGAQIGWGFQFQSPLFVLAMAYLMFAVGLSLSGVFFVGGSLAGVGSGLASKSGYSGSFFTGVLATLVATPCTAPFMAAALGYALTQPTFKLLAIFLSLGFGLALPYLLLTNWPALQRWLPRPGAWMDYTKQALAFPMYAASAWLIWVLAQQSGADAVVIALLGLIAIAFAAWLYQSTRNSSIRVERFGAIATVLVVIVTLAGSYKIAALDNNQVAKGDHNWQAYSAEQLDQLRAEGKPVFLNFTASWCISCLANERVALSNQRVVDAFTQQGITYLKGDWTKRDANITKILTQFGRSGVPLYVYYPAGSNSQPVVLPQVLTPEIVLSHVAEATKNAANNTQAQRTISSNP